MDRSTKPLSYSGITTFEQCPLKYKFSRIDGIPDPAGPAAERGKNLHTDLEAWLADETHTPVEELERWRPTVNALRTLRAQAEVAVAITKDYEVCDFNDPHAWIRGVIDILILGETTIIGDWKSGKQKKHDPQLMFYQLMILVSHPQVQRVEGRIWHLDVPLEDSNYMTFSRSELPVLKRHWEPRIQAIHDEQHFLPKPGPLCNWCSYARQKGGPCPI